VRANASSASARRVSTVVLPWARISATTSAYCAGDVTMATQAWFFAAARVIAGPPMSIVSMSGASRKG
jgi:hypothetical protein